MVKSKKKNVAEPVNFIQCFARKNFHQKEGFVLADGFILGKLTFKNTMHGRQSISKRVAWFLFDFFNSDSVNM